ncbi:MAG: S1 family peptidase [Nocardioidaceae bacterium]
MSVSSNTRRRLFMLGAAAATTALLLAPATSANARPDTARLDASATKGTTVAVAQDRLADRLDRDLGAAQSGGAYIDKAGELVVTVTDHAAARQVNASGATSRQVAYSSAQLDDVKRTLDRFAKRSGAGAVQGWFVDVRSNNVVVTATKGASNAATAQFLDKARSFGDRVAINRTTADAVPAALYGGQQVNMSNGFICSNGFNAQTSSGQYILLTAGHCAEGNPTFSRNGTTIGGTRGYSFPGNDYASVNINNPSFWNPQGAVDMYNGYARVVRGYSNAAVGSSLCKSGRTTGWTCGTIQAKNQTVNYGGGDIVSGLVRHSACVEQGDSGGSNMTGNYAQGLSSGGALYSQGGRLVCGEKVGQPNISYYQPVGEALNAYGARLITQ